MLSRASVSIAVAAMFTAPAMAGQVGKTAYPDPMMRGDTPATSNGWTVTPVFTVGETLKSKGTKGKGKGSKGGYTPVGILDGIGAFPRKEGKLNDGAVILVNHELSAGAGYPYTLANGAEIPGGARVSFVEIGKQADKPEVKDSGLAYDTIYDRSGAIVTDADQLEFGSFNRFCSARSVAEGEFGMEDDIFLTGEETGGGTQWVIDVHNQDIWAAPAMGRGAWESWTPVESGDDEKVAFLGGDDRGGAPLYLYVGEKDTIGDDSFLDRNGLAQGQLYCWKANSGVLDPSGFNGFFNTEPGTFVEVANFDPAQAGQPGYDELGYAEQEKLDELTAEAGCFQFSRPEDLHNDPVYPNRVVMASTGRDRLFPEDSWGTVYVIDTKVRELVGDITILHDADALPDPDFGIRSPDNLTWASDGMIYVQEDRSFDDFGQTSGIEASAWQLSPVTGDYLRIAEMCRDTNSSGDCDSVAPDGSTDGDPTDLGDWESSGVLDVTHLFKTEPGELLLIADVQAHSIRDGIIEEEELVQGGQLIFLSRVAGDDVGDDDDDDDRSDKKGKKDKR